MSAYKPINAFDMFSYFQGFDKADKNVIKLFLLKTIKYYCKAYPDIIKNVMVDYRYELFPYFEYENPEKVITAYLKKYYEISKK